MVQKKENHHRKRLMVCLKEWKGYWEFHFYSYSFCWSLPSSSSSATTTQHNFSFFFSSLILYNTSFPALLFYFHHHHQHLVRAFSRFTIRTQSERNIALWKSICINQIQVRLALCVEKKPPRIFFSCFYSEMKKKFPPSHPIKHFFLVVVVVLHYPLCQDFFSGCETHTLEESVL